MQDCAIIILAAGASNRMGYPKQLLSFEGSTFIQRTVQAALDSGAGSVWVILGANAEQLRPHVQAEAKVLLNEQWREGMASSIRCGLGAVKEIQPSAIILMVCDQPHINSSLLRKIIESHLTSGKRIIVSDYGNAMGPPALFHHSLFPELLNLKGDSGARKIIESHKEEIQSVSFPLGVIDIDTLEEFENLQKEN